MKIFVPHIKGFMLIGEIIISAIISGLLTLFFNPLLKRNSIPVLYFFPLLFLVVLSSGRWINVGPELNGIYFLPMLISGIIISVLMVLFSGSSKPPRLRDKYTSRTFPAQQDGSDQDNNKSPKYLNLLLWFVIFSLLVITLISYF